MASASPFASCLQSTQTPHLIKREALVQIERKYLLCQAACSVRSNKRTLHRSYLFDEHCNLSVGQSRMTVWKLALKNPFHHAEKYQDAQSHST